ncbi:MAG: hypothetical protein MUE54_10735 [Anaerolineae bacterium]|jgi:hypothetical protein|nr:hypothetical protein [Anaerolineae bacterium]
MLFQDICAFIESNLHTLTPTRPIIIPLAQIVITIDDFNHASNYQSLGEILSDPAKMELVVADLALVAGEMWSIR